MSFANAPRDAQMLSQLIPLFDTSERVQMSRFVSCCDELFDLCLPDQCKTLLNYTLNRIIGPQSVGIHTKNFSKWRDLRYFLILNYSNDKTLCQLCEDMELTYPKDSESMANYFYRVDLGRRKIIEQLHALITDASLFNRIALVESFSLKVFAGRLNTEIGMMLRAQRFGSLLEAGNFAMRRENISDLNRARLLIDNIQSLGHVPSYCSLTSALNNFEVEYTNLFCDPYAARRNCKKLGHASAELRNTDSGVAKTLNSLIADCTKITYAPTIITSALDKYQILRADSAKHHSKQKLHISNKPYDLQLQHNLTSHGSRPQVKNQFSNVKTRSLNNPNYVSLTPETHNDIFVDIESIINPEVPISENIVESIPAILDASKTNAIERDQNRSYANGLYCVFKANNEPLTLLVDTGCTSSMLKTTSIGNTFVDSSKTVPITGFNGSIGVITKGTAEISLDGLPEHRFFVADLNTSVDGYLGNDFMSKFNVRIDVKSKIMFIRDERYRLYHIFELPGNYRNNIIKNQTCIK